LCQDAFINPVVEKKLFALKQIDARRQLLAGTVFLEFADKILPRQLAHQAVHFQLKLR
jgi:hypothetical protein